MHSTFLRAAKKSDNRSALILSPRLIAIVVSVEQLSTKCVFIQEQKVNILGSFNHFLEWNRNLIDPERWPLPLLLRNYRLFFVSCPSLTPWGVVLRRVPRGVNRLKQWRMKSNIFPFVPVRLAFWDEKCFFFYWWSLELGYTIVAFVVGAEALVSLKCWRIPWSNEPRVVYGWCNWRIFGRRFEKGSMRFEESLGEKLVGLFIFDALYLRKMGLSFSN